MNQWSVTNQVAQPGFEIRFLLRRVLDFLPYQFAPKDNQEKIFRVFGGGILLFLPKFGKKKIMSSNFKGLSQKGNDIALLFQ